MLEWSSLYRVALLLSKINDDADLDAEAAILYGKVGLKRLRKRCIFNICELHVSTPYAFLILFNTFVYSFRWSNTAKRSRF